MVASTPPDRVWRNLRILSLVYCVAAPVTYLVIALALNKPPAENNSGMAMTVYVLLAVAIIQPALAFPVARFQVQSHQRSQQARINAAALFQTISIVKFAFVEAVFIYGLVVYLVGAGLTAMLWFYPIGIVWSFIYWPRREQFDAFIKKMETT
jgi:hypothetical protein